MAQQRSPWHVSTCSKQIRGRARVHVPRRMDKPNHVYTFQVPARAWREASRVLVSRSRARRALPVGLGSLKPGQGNVPASHAGVSPDFAVSRTSHGATAVLHIKRDVFEHSQQCRASCEQTGRLRLTLSQRVAQSSQQSQASRCGRLNGNSPAHLSRRVYIERGGAVPP